MSPRIQTLYSENNAFQFVETLRRNRAKRHRHGAFFVEGVRPINQALAYGWPVSAFYYANDKPLSGWAQHILADSAAETHYELPFALLSKLSLKNEPSELLAVFKTPSDDFERIPIRDNPLIVLFDRPASPGNLGSIIRSCDALGADGLVITGHSVDLYDPETISATTGSLFALPVIRKTGVDELLPWLETIRQRIGSVQLVGSSEDALEAVYDHDFTQPTLIALGNETWGLSAAYRASCDCVVRIPMGGSASSLNVASAAAIVLYEISRQRRTSPHK